MHVGSADGDKLGLILALSIILVAFLVLVPFAVSCLAATVILAKDKAKLQKELESKATIYEEIEIKQQSTLMETDENIAYAITAEWNT